MKKLNNGVSTMWMSLLMASGLLACGEMSAEEGDALSQLATQEQALSTGEVNCHSKDPFWKIRSHSKMLTPGRYEFTSYLNETAREIGILTLSSSSHAELFNQRSGRVTGRLTRDPNDRLSWIWTSTEVATLSIPFACDNEFLFKPVASTSSGACRGNADCGPNQFCQFDESHANDIRSAKACGVDGRRGSCAARPTSCAGQGNPGDMLYGCDHRPYDNACWAHQSGTSVYYVVAAY